MGYGGGEERKPSRRRRPARGSNRNLLIIGGAAVAVLIVIVAVAVVAMGGGDGKKDQAAAAARVTPKVYVNTPANSLVNKLNRRTDDKRPLNKSEVFGDDSKSVSHGTYHFTLAGSQLSDCASA